MQTLLSLQRIESGYAAAKVVHGISLDVGAAEVVALLGANGAGKTTTLMTILGLLRLTAGQITFDGRSIGNRATSYLVKQGISVVPEGRRVFGSLSVEENLMIGSASGASGRVDRGAIDEALALFPDLVPRMKQLAGSLSGGQQQMLAIARALASRPRLILMDEPTMGLSPVLGEKVMSIISEIRGKGVSVLLVEQNAHAALSVASRGYVLQAGEIVLQGAASELRESSVVKEAYL
jgi:branched-chain amino acid transport system ATP-binding protein